MKILKKVSPPDIVLFWLKVKAAQETCKAKKREVKSPGLKC